LKTDSEGRFFRWRGRAFHRKDAVLFQSKTGYCEFSITGLMDVCAISQVV
jgi:hypothetical protein